MIAELPDDELLNIPLGNLLPGELKRAFRINSEQNAKKQEEESRHTVELSATLRRDEETETHEREELERYEVRLLERIYEREEELQIESAGLDQRAIKLHDGRRAYVDGDRYRDAEGRELSGADRAQAEVLHLEQPHAATWQEKQKIEEQWAAIETVRRDVEKAHDTGGASTVPPLMPPTKSCGGCSPALRHRRPDYPITARAITCAS